MSNIAADLGPFHHHLLDDSDCIQTQINDEFHQALWIDMLQLFVRLNNPASDSVCPPTGLQK